MNISDDESKKKKRRTRVYGPGSMDTGAQGPEESDAKPACLELFVPSLFAEELWFLAGGPNCQCKGHPQGQGQDPPCVSLLSFIDLSVLKTAAYMIHAYTLYMLITEIFRLLLSFLGCFPSPELIFHRIRLSRCKADQNYWFACMITSIWSRFRGCYCLSVCLPVYESFSIVLYCSLSTHLLFCSIAGMTTPLALFALL